MSLSRYPGDEFSDFVENLQALARVITGVSIETGIVDKLIPPDVVIAELLHMGGVTLDDIIGLTDENIEKALNELENLKKKGAEKEVIDAENRLTILDEMREKAAIYKGLASPEHLTGYKEGLEKIKDVGKLKKSLNDFKSSVTLSILSFESLKFQKGPLSDKNQDQVFFRIKNIFEYLVEIEKVAKAFNSTMTALKEAKKIIPKSEFIKNLLDEDNYRTQKLRSLPKTYDVEPLLGSFQSAFFNSTTLHNFESINQLIATRDPLFRQEYKYTSGLPQGTADLDLLSMSAGNEWIASAATQILRKAFTQLDPLRKTLKEVEKKWLPLENQSIKRDIKELSELFTQVKENSTISLREMVKGLETCGQQPVELSFLEKETFDEILKEVESVNDRIRNISDFAYMDQLKDLSALKAHFPKDPKKEEAQNTLKILQTNEDILNFESTILTLKQDLEYFINVAENSATIANVTLDGVESYQSELGKRKYLEVYTCLEAIKINGSSIGEVIDVARQARNFTVTPDIRESLNSIVHSGGVLKDARNEVEKLIDGKSNEILEFSGISDYPLGIAVQGLAVIRRTADIQILFHPLMNLKNISTSELTADEQKAVKDVEQLSEVFQSIDDFLQNISGFTKKSDLQSVEVVFDEGGKVKGVDIDTKNLRRALEKLQKTQPNVYNSTVAAMDHLETLDLNFSRFQIADVIPSLPLLNQFFKKFEPAPTPSKPHKSARYNKSPPKIVWPPEWLRTPLYFAMAVTLIAGFLLLYVLSKLNRFFERGRPLKKNGKDEDPKKKSIATIEASKKKPMGVKRSPQTRPGTVRKPGMVPRPGTVQKPGMVQKPGAVQKPGMVQRPGTVQRRRQAVVTRTRGRRRSSTSRPSPAVQPTMKAGKTGYKPKTVKKK